MCSFPNISQDKVPSRTCPAPPQGLVISPHLSRLLGVMGEVAAPQGHGWSQWIWLQPAELEPRPQSPPHLTPRNWSHCGVKLPGWENDPASLFYNDAQQPVGKLMVGRVPKTHLPIPPALCISPCHPQTSPHPGQLSQAPWGPPWGEPWSSGTEGERDSAQSKAQGLLGTSAVSVPSCPLTEDGGGAEELGMRVGEGEPPL